MKLLTYHGTIVRHTGDRARLSHAPLDAADPNFVDADVGETGALPFVSHLLIDAIEIEPGSAPGTVRLKQNGSYVCADPNLPIMTANRSAASIWETFLLLTGDEVMLLRWMMGHGWRTGGSSAPPDERKQLYRPVLAAGFILQIGGSSVDLAVSRPTINSVLLPASDPSAAPMSIECGPAVDEAAEIALRPTTEEWRRLEVTTRDDFLARSERALEVAAPPDHFELPITGSPEERDFCLQRFWNGGQPRLGAQQARCQIRRSRDKYVLLQRYCEGIIFDRHGTYSEAGYFHTLHTYPSGLRRDGDTVMLDCDVLAQAQQLSGTYVVMFNPHLSNYYHWLVESMLALDVMHRDLPSGTQILLPGTLAGFRQTRSSGFDHRRIMELLEFDQIPVVEVDAAICHVDEAVWLEKYSIDQIPGRALTAFRDRIERRLGSGAARNRRIYVQRCGLRQIANAQEVEFFCWKNGFTIYRLEDVEDDEQIRIFQEAAFVIAPHGAGLSNLLFCQPGTKVIELSPDVEFRPFFWQIAQRLGLPYGLLACPTSDGSFHGNMTVDIDKLRKLYRCVENGAGTLVSNGI